MTNVFTSSITSCYLLERTRLMVSIRRPKHLENHPTNTHLYGKEETGTNKYY